MPTPLHNELNWHKAEIELCNQIIAEMEAKYAPSPERAAALARIQATRKAHEETLGELEKQLAQGT